MLEILKLAGLDSFSLINEYRSETELEESLVEFTRTTAIFIRDSEEWPQDKCSLVFGVFHKDPTKFLFIPGQKMMRKKPFSRINEV